MPGVGEVLVRVRGKLAQLPRPDDSQWRLSWPIDWACAALGWRRRRAAAGAGVTRSSRRTGHQLFFPNWFGGGRSFDTRAMVVDHGRVVDRVQGRERQKRLLPAESSDFEEAATHHALRDGMVCGIGGEGGRSSLNKERAGFAVSYSAGQGARARVIARTSTQTTRVVSVSWAPWRVIDIRDSPSWGDKVPRVTEAWRGSVVESATRYAGQSDPRAIAYGGQVSLVGGADGRGGCIDFMNDVLEPSDVPAGRDRHPS